MSREARPAHVKITMRKHMGDDAYSWAVFKDGRPVITGLSRTEAVYHKNVIRQMYEERAERAGG